jgi:hypothetical protein
MKNREKINSMSSLEKEILRLKLEAKRQEGKLEDNFERLQRNYGKMIVNSISCGKNEVVNRVTDFVERIFSKK